MNAEISHSIRLDHVRAFAARVEHSLAPTREADQHRVGYFFDAAEDVVTRMQAVTGRSGCVVGFIKPGESGFAVFREVGNDRGGNPDAPNELDQEKLAKHFTFASAKVMELMQHEDAVATSQLPDQTSKLMLGFISEAARDGKITDPDVLARLWAIYGQEHLYIGDLKDTWAIPGGAVRIGDMIVVVSGYPQGEDDEAAALAMAVVGKVADQEGVIDRAIEIGGKTEDRFFALRGQLLSGDSGAVM